MTGVGTITQKQGSGIDGRKHCCAIGILTYSALAEACRESIASEEGMVEQDGIKLII